MGKYMHEIRLKGQRTQTIEPDQVILHSLGNGNNFESGWAWMVALSNALEAHVAVRLDGYRRQAVPYTSRADANYTANGPDARGKGAISVETDSSVNATEPWTDDQFESLVELLTELCIEFDIPARLCRHAEDPGIGWHIQFGTPGAWTPVAKACPGVARIKQVPLIIARVAANVAAVKAGKPVIEVGGAAQHEIPVIPTKAELAAMADIVIFTVKGKKFAAQAGASTYHEIVSTYADYLNAQRGMGLDVAEWKDFPKFSGGSNEVASPAGFGVNIGAVPQQISLVKSVGTDGSFSAAMIRGLDRINSLYGKAGGK